MKQINLSGMGVALITPFRADNQVDYPALSRLVELHLTSGTDYLIVLGTTAETPALSPEEQKKIVQLVVAQVDKKLPVVMGLGGNHTAALVQRLKTEDFTGVDAMLSVVPYYNKPSQEGIYQHYKALAEATELPIVLYNVPGRTGVNMTVDTCLRLAHEFENIVAVKEASGNLTQISALLKNKPTGFQVISGDDCLAFPAIALGAVGVASVLGNAFPKAFAEMVHHALNGNHQQALPIHHNFAELMELLFVDGNPAGVKCVLATMGYCENVLRLPLVPVPLATQEKILKYLNPDTPDSGKRGFFAKLFKRS
ncbi:MAG: 4-hydroxy-tetrahydrodipicolinate synthase [Candidatus Symbiothrix sp.]|jgi:4-hydroxy-tetrahydrodipicolinate synthase|nr:4-hydroxy-tetrahydrodipicolinate synthase [Candidatus Symbiothrix sp.]